MAGVSVADHQSAGPTYSELRRRAELLRIKSYRVEIDLTAIEDAAVSRTEITFGCCEPGASSFADLTPRRVTKVTLNGVDLPDSVFVDGRILLRDLASSNLLTVEAEVDYSTDGRGLCRFVDPDDGSVYVYTKGMPFSAPRIMCCFTGTGMAPIDITVATPPGWHCTSHTAVVECPTEGETRRWRFATTRPMVPEQLVIAAGQWVRARTGGRDNADIGTSNVTLYGRRSCLDALNASPAAAIASECLDFQARALGVPYSFDRLSLLFVPDYSALGGTSPGVTALHERMLHESVEDASQTHVLWALAHEIAHSWFGSLVMDRGWEATWLTEGLATYLCHLTMEHIGSEFDPWARFHVLEEPSAHEADENADIHPVAWAPPGDAPLAKPGQTYAAMAPIIYSKPAALLRQLAAMFSVESVLAGLARYLDRHSFAEATTDDLLVCLSEVCGTDLGSWADEWLRTPGVNTLELVMSTSTDGLVQACQVLQHRAAADPILRRHMTSIEVFDMKDSVLHLRSRSPLTVDGTATLVPELVGARAPQLAVLNAPALTYARVRLDERSRRALAEHLGDLSPDSRATCWVSGWEMVRDGLMARDEFASWVDRHGDEPDPAVRALLAAKAAPAKG